MIRSSMVREEPGLLRTPWSRGVPLRPIRAIGDRWEEYWSLLAYCLGLIGANARILTDLPSQLSIQAVGSLVLLKGSF